jgi:hypothetical protein
MDPNDANDWAFTFSHSDFATLQGAMEEITEAFAAEVDVDPDQPVGSFDDAPVTEDEDGNQTTGPPQFTIEYSGVASTVISPHY